MQRRTFLGAMSAAGMLAATGMARAQSGATRIVVGASPGGGTDTVARLMAQELGRLLGGTFVVDNKPGAGGNIAAQQVANAEPDGRTLLMCYTSHAINATLYPKLPFDPIKDFSPIACVANAPSILLARPGIKANTIRELIALAKAEPGTLNMALPGIGSSGHLASEVLKTRAGVDITLIPYKGTAPAMNDLLGGQVDLMFATAALAKAQMDNKTLKPLGVSSAQRMVSAPNVAPIADVLPGYDFSAWYGLLGPAGIKPELAQQISAAVEKTLAQEPIRRKLLDEGLVAQSSSPDAFGAFVKSEVERWGAVVKATGAKVT